MENNKIPVFQPLCFDAQSGSLLRKRLQRLPVAEADTTEILQPCISEGISEQIENINSRRKVLPRKAKDPRDTSLPQQEKEVGDKIQKMPEYETSSLGKDWSESVKDILDGCGKCRRVDVSPLVIITISSKTKLDSINAEEDNVWDEAAFKWMLSRKTSPFWNKVFGTFDSIVSKCLITTSQEIEDDGDHLKIKRILIRFATPISLSGSKRTRIKKSFLIFHALRCKELNLKVKEGYKPDVRVSIWQKIQSYRGVLLHKINPAHRCHASLFYIKGMKPATSTPSKKVKHAKKSLVPCVEKTEEKRDAPPQPCIPETQAQSVHHSVQQNQKTVTAPCRLTIDEINLLMFQRENMIFGRLLMMGVITFNDIKVMFPDIWLKLAKFAGVSLYH